MIRDQGHILVVDDSSRNRLKLSRFLQQQDHTVAEAKLGEQGFYEIVESLEKRLITNALQQNQGHREKTAAMLKILPRILHRKMKKYGSL